MKRTRRKTRAEKVEETDPLGVPTEFYCPDSGAIVGASYEPRQRVLRVTLKRLPHPTYEATGVPEQEWRDFFYAVSKGTHFAQRLQTQFGFRLVVPG